MKAINMKTWVACLCAAYLAGYLTRPVVVRSIEFLRRFRQAWNEVQADQFADNVSDHIHDQDQGEGR